MIKLENVSRIYGEGEGAVKALEGISLEIPSGKFISIIGKSGSGKTTLLNLIGGLDKPSNGSIYFNDLCISELNNNKLAQFRNEKIGFVFQSFYLEPSFTVIQNVELPLIIAGIDKKTRREKSIEIIKKLGLEEKANKKANTLSGGEKQRVSIARALINSPQLILADEPTGNLDSKNSEEVISILKKISEEGKTVILVTHNMEDAKKTDYSIEITDGKIFNHK